jgi:hypothetical protein
MTSGALSAVQAARSASAQASCFPGSIRVGSIVSKYPYTPVSRAYIMQLVGVLAQLQLLLRARLTCSIVPRRVGHLSCSRAHECGNGAGVTCVSDRSEELNPNLCAVEEEKDEALEAQAQKNAPEVQVDFPVS